jgi:guanidinoacetate N-methyltransferase
METWEEPYMKRLAEISSKNGGKVLEIGFGMGISAKYIQKSAAKEHHIIEANDQVFNTMSAFSETANIRVFKYQGFWEDVSKTFEDEMFDGILFDTYPITEDELHTARFSFFSEAYRLLKRGGIFTHYTGELKFTDEYIKHIVNAGFQEFSGELIAVDPPETCLYWENRYILAPTILKT